MTLGINYFLERVVLVNAGLQNGAVGFTENLSSTKMLKTGRLQDSHLNYFG